MVPRVPCFFRSGFVWSARGTTFRVFHVDHLRGRVPCSQRERPSAEPPRAAVRPCPLDSSNEPRLAAQIVTGGSGHPGNHRMPEACGHLRAREAPPRAPGRPRRREGRCRYVGSPPEPWHAEQGPAWALRRNVLRPGRRSVRRECAARSPACRAVRVPLRPALIRYVRDLTGPKDLPPWWTPSTGIPRTGRILPGCGSRVNLVV